MGKVYLTGKANNSMSSDLEKLRRFAMQLFQDGYAERYFLSQKRWFLMSEVRTSHSLEKIQQEFEHLLQNLDNLLREVRPRTNIQNTKLWKLKKDLESISEIDDQSQAKVAEIVTKYVTLNHIFNSNIQYSKKDLAKIIEGKSDYKLDSNDNYNDYFFELSMGLRFLLSHNGKATIKFDGVCDVIINDKIAIECKYIHSKSNIIKNIRKANNQIEKRIAENQAKIGFIALDLSHVLSTEKVKEFAHSAFDKFVENYKILKSRGRIEGDIPIAISENDNFKKIISSFVMHEAETTLYAELGFDYDMGSNTAAILFQAVNTFFFEFENSGLPLTTRGMTYFWSFRNCCG